MSVKCSHVNTHSEHNIPINRQLERPLEEYLCLQLFLENAMGFFDEEQRLPHNDLGLQDQRSVKNLHQ